MKKYLLSIALLTLLLSSCGIFPSTSQDPDAGLTYTQRLYAHSQDWGLGASISTYVTNDRDYDWYIDQQTTGTYWSVNCGPTSVEMAGHFSNESFGYTAEDARAIYRPGGGWWYDSDIQGALTQFQIPNQSSTIGNATDLMSLLDTGGVVLVNPDMSRIAMEAEPDDRVGLFYQPGTGHYLIVKGYVVVDGNTFFEVHDPWSIGVKYDNGELKGKNRYYDAVTFLDAILNWWPKVYTITQI